MNKVTLTYFKLSGKFYAESELEVPENLKSLGQVCSLVRLHMESRTLPGLLEGHSPFTVLVEHEGVPILLHPIEMMENDAIATARRISEGRRAIRALHEAQADREERELRNAFSEAFSIPRRSSDE